jgi:hypothetical protein
MGQNDLNTGLLTLDRTTCMELLATEQLGRLVLVIGGRPEIFPVNYAVDGDGIIFRTERGTKLSGAAIAPVLFEVDHLDPADGSAWSVILRGRCGLVGDYDSPMLRGQISGQPRYPWAGGDKPYVLRIQPTSVTGRRIASRVARAS